MNSSHMYGDTPSRNGFGINLAHQLIILNKMVDTMSTMKVNKSLCKSTYKFQKGILLSCYSLSELYEMLHNLYDIKFLLTRRLN